jgi:ATP-dependent Lon protease
LKLSVKRCTPRGFRARRLAEQNLYTRSRELVGERNLKEHEIAVQIRSFDAAKSGSQVGVGVLVALCSALLGKSLKGGLIIVGDVNLGGSIEPVHNPIDVVELALETGALSVMIPVSCRRLVDLSNDVATKVQVLFYSDAPDALRRRCMSRLAIAEADHGLTPRRLSLAAFRATAGIHWNARDVT